MNNDWYETIHESAGQGFHKVLDDVSQNVQNVFNRSFGVSDPFRGRITTGGKKSSRNLQPLVDDIQAAGVTECGAQVERPVVSFARPGEVVLEAHMVRALQEERFMGRHTCHSRVNDNTIEY